MNENLRSEKSKEAFIRVKAQTMEDFGRVLKAIERSGGRILHSFPLKIIIGQLPEDKISGLRELGQITSIATGRIPVPKDGPNDLIIAIQTWNAHIQRREHPPRKDLLREGLSWDSPGFLPPDPPASIRKKLEEREREMKAKTERKSGGKK